MAGDGDSRSAYSGVRFYPTWALLSVSESPVQPPPVADPSV